MVDANTHSNARTWHTQTHKYTPTNFDIIQINETNDGILVLGVDKTTMLLFRYITKTLQLSVLCRLDLHLQLM